MRETFEHLVARVNASAYIPNNEPSANSARRLKMAKQVKLAKNKEFTFKATGGGGAGKYPWDAWFTGDLLLLERDITEPDGVDADGEPKFKTAPHGKRDFDVLTDAMPAKLKTAARRRYKVVQISRLDADGKRLVDSLIIKSRDMTPEERTEEDVLRAEEKAEAIARRKAQRTQASTDPAPALALATGTA